MMDFMDFKCVRYISFQLLFRYSSFTCVVLRLRKPSNDLECLDNMYIKARTQQVWMKLSFFRCYYAKWTIWAIQHAGWISFGFNFFRDNSKLMYLRIICVFKIRSTTSGVWQRDNQKCLSGNLFLSTWIWNPLPWLQLKRVN